MSKKDVVSKSRTYVAICNRPVSCGYIVRKFKIPEWNSNNLEFAEWYFVNVLDLTHAVEMFMTYEDYKSCKTLELREGAVTLEKVKNYHIAKIVLIVLTVVSTSVMAVYMQHLVLQFENGVAVKLTTAIFVWMFCILSGLSVIRGIDKDLK